jgi:hypothetical protein
MSEDKTSTSGEPVDTTNTPFERIIPVQEFEEEEKLFKQLNKQRIKTMQIKRRREAQIMADPRINPEQRKEMLDKWNTFDFNWRTLELLELTADYTVKQFELDDKERTKGKVYGLRMAIPGTGAITSIDLIYGTGNSNIPSGTILDLPFLPINKLTVFNEGPGILFWQAFNDTDFNPNKATVPFPPNMVVPYVMGGDLSEAVITWLNLRNTDSQGCTVSMILEL